jgi:hypothetical protein
MSGFNKPSVGAASNVQINSLGIGVAASGTTGVISFTGGATITGGGGNLTINVTTTFFQTYAVLQGGINTQSHASFTSGGAITSGSAVTPNVTYDTFVNINVVPTTTGTVTVTYGPTTGAENTWVPSTALLVGQGTNIGIPIPATWKFVVTFTGTTVAGTYGVHRY